MIQYSQNALFDWFLFATVLLAMCSKTEIQQYWEILCMAQVYLTALVNIH